VLQLKGNNTLIKLTCWWRYVHENCGKLDLNITLFRLFF